MTALDADTREPRGTAAQRARAALVGGLGATLGRLPAPVVDGLSDAVGELWYRLAPGRAATARGNLAHVAGWLAAEGRGSARARAAAADPAALERLVRGAFHHGVRSYAETLRGAAAARDSRIRLVIETPEAVDAAFAAGGPVIFSSPHFGSLVAVATVLADRTPVPITAPMETIDDPELQRVLLQARESGGARIVDLRVARRELRAALARGEGVGLVADRDIAGGGVPVTLFGLPARLPIGPAYLALDAGSPLHVAAARRSRGGFRGRLVTLPHPPADLPHRVRIEALLQAEARAFEDLIAAAPEQWWTVFYPTWDAVEPRSRGAAATRRPGPAAGAAPSGLAPTAASPDPPVPSTRESTP
jgi:phosphatidylinositol dimannoside acyltransferase